MTNTMTTRPNVLENGTPLFCDLYHLTMAQAWFLDGKAAETKTSEAFFRKCPFGGSFLLCAGLREFAEWLAHWHFTKEDIDDLRKDIFDIVEYHNEGGKEQRNWHVLTLRKIKMGEI
jgi:nicotinic acid phosphoribosyltransferase